MRRLLIKLVAIETALVGWLSYWLFLVYADNPAVAQSLGDKLAKFPQLAFTTIDISVLVIIGALALFLAFKFQRGLKPGIRLERALQMLENLMKRNLILESQVAEMKLERAQVTTPTQAPTPSEPRPGSWERAFRIPLEAGPAQPSHSNRPSDVAMTDARSEHETSTSRPSPPRVEPKARPPTDFRPKLLAPTPEKTIDKMPSADKSLDRQQFSNITSSVPSTWEDSPKYVGETSGILTASSAPRKTGASIPETGPQKQPYIPAPPPKAIPSTVILSPGVSPIPQAKPSGKILTGSQIGQKPRPAAPTPLPIPAGKPTAVTPSARPSASSEETTRSSVQDKSVSEPQEVTRSKEETEPPAKPSPRGSSQGKKRFPWEDE